MKKRLFFIFCIMLFGVMLSACNKSGKDNPTPVPQLTPQPEITDTGELITYKVSGAVSSNMVVQQDSYINVWGTSDNESGYIYADFMGETRYSEIDKYGYWKIQFSPHDYTSEPQTMKIYPLNGDKTEFTDILIGDVWIIAGQSNAKMQVTETLDLYPDVQNEASENDNIRLFFQEVDTSTWAGSFVEQDDIIRDEFTWKKANYDDSVEHFSAYGYYFAKEFTKHSDVPIGLVMVAEGGMSLKEFMSVDLRMDLSLTVGTGSRIYNALIYPLQNMSIKGLMMYQGENDVWEYDIYGEWLAKWVEDLRKEFKTDFEFYDIQLTSHGDEVAQDWAAIGVFRCAQLEAMSNIPNSHIISTIDRGTTDGDENDAHPRDKQHIGIKLAHDVLINEYGSHDFSAKYDICPMPQKLEKHKDYVVVYFNNVGDGLRTSTDGTLDVEGFYLMDRDGYKIPVKAQIIGKNKVKVSLKDDQGNYADFTPLYVAYGVDVMASSEFATLCNSNMMYSIAFRLLCE